ncbi:MAG: FHA domain-containing protein [Myxococcota bacterium]|nr:FHA domain-containing protein [Myxococcota bacterium]
MSICEWCGSTLAPPKRKTQSENRAAGGGAAVVSGPGEKRRTMYEPSTQPSRRPPVDDFFGNPPPSRPPLRDPEDPFAQSVRPAAAAAQPTPQASAPSRPAPPPAAPHAGWGAAAPQPSAPKNRTIIENPASPAASAQRRIRGALFCYTSPDDPGSILPLHDGRNSMGRNDDRDVVLADGRISGEHGFLYVREDRHTYVDTSSNGSRVDGQIVYGEQIEVRSGTVLEIGGMRLILVIISPDAVSQ